VLGRGALAAAVEESVDVVDPDDVAAQPCGGRPPERRWRTCSRRSGSSSRG
jgi:hypothetical protein